MQASQLYAAVSEAIVTQLQAGNLQPWRCPWSKAGGGFPLRHNGTPYRGCNTLWLWMTASARGYGSPYFLTFKQCKEYGEAVKAGEKSTPVVYCQPMSKEGAADDGTPTKDTWWMTRVYHVFNSEQCVGLPERYTANVAPQLDPSQKIEHAETYIANTGARIEHGGHAAYYRPISDTINLPPFEHFNSPEDYYSTAAHELHHWAGVSHRLGRFTYVDKKREEYAREEIIAELAATMTATQLGFDAVSKADDAAYLDHWIKAIKEDTRYVFTAASKAQASCDFLNGLQPPEVAA